jgi:hypothetical protein
MALHLLHAKVKKIWVMILMNLWFDLQTCQSKVTIQETAINQILNGYFKRNRVVSEIERKLMSRQELSKFKETDSTAMVVS